MRHLPLSELEGRLDHIRQSPRDQGTVGLIVRRPGENERETLAEGQLTTEAGLVGDVWSTPESGSPDIATQVTLMNARAADAVAGTRDRWPLAGDQLYVDFDLSEANLVAGMRLQVGEAIVEVTDEPHLGCGKFAARFGTDAAKFVNSAAGRVLRLRGINTRVVRGGSVRMGDRIERLDRPTDGAVVTAQERTSAAPGAS
jgi:MOSC domain-containing protein YiiM